MNVLWLSNILFPEPCRMLGLPEPVLGGWMYAGAQELMKAANVAIRMKDPTEGDAKLAELGYTPEDIAKLREPDFCGRIGYPAYLLQNNNANIRRIRGRIEELKKRTENTPEAGSSTGAGSW